MKIAIIGTGYVGLVTGACFAEMGNGVYCIDKDAVKIDYLNKGILPIFEQGLEDMVKSNRKQGNLIFSTDLREAIQESEFCFVAVGTPPGEDGSADLKYVLEVAKEIGQSMDCHKYIVNKSTVPVGTADKVRATIQSQLDLRGEVITFDVISNPEFLKEGTAVNDCMSPDRIVVGADNENALKAIKNLYQPFFRTSERFVTMDIKSAEMTKYAANSILATKISFINEMANICERVGADINKVRVGIGSDSRIGYQFIYPGCGYGGSCFPKDVHALIRTSEENEYEPQLLKAVEAVNQKQKFCLVEKIFKKYSTRLDGKTFAIWGLSFKPNTDDMREASSITVIKELVKAGAKVKVYDPKAMEEAKKIYFAQLKNICYCNSKYETLKDSDVMILITEWKEFRSPDFYEMRKMLKEPVIFDGRNQYDAEILSSLGFEYYQIGVGN